MDVVGQLNAALSDRYDIEREIGSGGMATVYLGRDIRHNRRVAVKVLRPELGAVLGVERFLAEIETTANLQHPHLLPLFDSGEASGLLFYVMPYVEGESLRHRLDRERQLPVDEAVRIAIAVAGALDYAHRHDIVHRDLKPENILLHDGQPLVSDFGIALAVSNAGGGRITQTGLSLGTPHYMSPEQATGDRAIDARSDIYSLGAMLYEMLLGEPPHTGGTVQAVIAKVLTDRPHSMRGLRESIPPHVEAAVFHALSKLPADRFGTAAEFAEALKGARTVSMPSFIHPHPQARSVDIRQIAPIAAGAVIVLLAGFWVFAPKPEPAGAPAMFELTFNDSTSPTTVSGVPLSIDPKGTQLAYVGRGPSGNTIFLRPLNDLRPHSVKGTENSISPVFSPDGEWLLFNSSGGLKKVAISGGAPITLMDSVAGNASWTDDHHILTIRQRAVYMISDEGGDARMLATPDSQAGHLGYAWPCALPGSKAALIVIFKGVPTVEGATLGLINLRNGKVTELGLPGTRPQYLSTGHIVFARADGALMGAKFSLRRLKITGPITPLVEGVVVKSGGAAEFTVSRTGTLVYNSGEAGAALLVRVDRKGVQTQLGADPAPYSGPRLSSDGRRVAVTVSAASLDGDVWVYDLASNTRSRVTTDGRSRRPVWTPDGRELAYINRDSISTGYNIKRKPWDGSGEARTFMRTKTAVLEIVFARHSPLIVTRSGTGSTRDLQLASVDSPNVLHPFLTSPAAEESPDISPDGSLLAYASDESGRMEVYVRPVPGPGPRVQVSNEGGREPLWSRDGREVFYRGPGYFMTALIKRNPELTVERRDSLFKDVFGSDADHTSYDVFPDGKSFILVQRETRLASMIAVVNWTQELRRKASTRGD